MAISKETVELKTVKDGTEAIASLETMMVKGAQMDSFAYKSENRKVEALLISTLNKNLILKQGT